MSAIVDVQGFKTDDNVFIVKEIAIQCNKHILVLLIGPPFPFKALTKTERNQVCWIERNRKIYWHEGFIPYSSYKDYIIEYLKNKSRIFVKGYEKANWIREMLYGASKIDGNINVINIEDFECPNLQSLHDKYQMCSEIYNCIYHSAHCALRNVNCLFKWSIENKLF